MHAHTALDLIKNDEVQAIIGPEKSIQTDFVIDLGHKSQVPIISFSATSPSLTSIHSPYFIRATQNDSTQVKPISAILQTYGWRQAVVIYADDEFGGSIIRYVTDALQEIDVRVSYRSVISPLATDDQIREELYKLMTMQTRVFIVHMLPNLGNKVFAKANEVGMMSEGYVWIVTGGIANLMSSMDLDNMQGVLGVKTFVPKSKEIAEFTVRWKREFQKENLGFIDAHMNVYGIRAYDATKALAMAAERAWSIANSNPNSLIHKFNSSNNATDLESFGVSQFGPELLQAFSTTKFKGLIDDFNLVNGQIESSTFQIVNVLGNGEKGIGFWTPTNGLMKKPPLKNTTIPSSTSEAKLGPVIWPGDSTSFPKGWQFPISGTKLRVGVPVKNGFSEFLKVIRDPNTNTTSVTGYCIDVFDSVMKAMPYAVTYDYIPFETPDGESKGTYDDLIYQVYAKNYDAVVGDTTIIANRSAYVDFTLPYTESGVSMIVPIRDKKKKNAWVFLKPLTWDLWVTSFCFFVFIGFVVWVLEHRVNEDFRGPPKHQIGTTFWFSFSTMVFAQRENVVSNLARFVVLIWFFVVLILTQSYTASLTSFLTVEQLQPTVTNFKELVNKGDKVGYQQGSFVLGILKELGFDDSKLLVYDSPEECDELFSKGRTNGGIVAAFDEVPYTKLFLGQYCSKYTLVEPTFKTAGFGFVFPIGSPLVPDVSRAVLNVTEGDKMREINNAWFKTQACPDRSTSFSSNRLGLDSFWGLFLIAGVASLSAVFIFAIVFVHDHWHVLQQSDSEYSLCERVIALVRIFDQKDMSSHTFRKQDVRSSLSPRCMVLAEASPNTHCPPSPSSTGRNTHCPTSPSGCSNQIDPDFSFPCEEGRVCSSNVEVTQTGHASS